MDQNGLETKSVLQDRLSPGALVHPMEGAELEQAMWQVLVKNGLDAKKLSVFGADESSLIARQICEQLGVICESWHEDLVLGWILSVSSAEPFQKRLRGDHQQDPLVVGSLSQQHFSRSSSSSGSGLGRTSKDMDFLWTPLSAKQRALRDQTEAKQEHENALKDRWSKELYKELMKVQAPILNGMEICVNQSRVHVAIAGKTRPSTLKRYIKAWRDWQTWKLNTWGSDVFVHPGMFCEYLFNRFDEPCGATVPNFICKAVAWFEKTAGFDTSDTVALSRAVIQIRDYLTEKLSADAPPVRRAPRYPAVAVEALESLVLDTNELVGMRIMAWVKLLKIWGALRYDDMQKIKPGDLHLTGGRLTTTLRVTKTSGPGKRVQELPVCISEQAFVWDSDWIPQGFQLLKTYADFDRDYLLPKLTADWGGFMQRYATYQDVTAYSCRLRKHLVSHYDINPLFPEDFASFWTEHSERATLPTALAMLGVQGAQKDLVGRWKPEASDTYVRAYNGLVSQLQAKYSKTLRKHDRYTLLDEIDIIESADAWLRDRKSEISDDERADLVHTLMSTLDSFAVQEPVGTFANPEPMSEDFDVADLETTGDDRLESKAQRETGYIIVTTGRNCKRLHKAKGGCWMAREKIFKESAEYEDKPPDTEFTHVCRICWPKPAEKEDSSGETSSDDSNGSSSSSGSSDS